MKHQCLQRRQFLLLVGSLLATVAMPTWAAGASGEVKQLLGQAWRNDQPLKLGDPISLGDHLRTGADSKLVVRLDNDVYLLRANGSLQLEKKGLVLGSLRLLSGALLAVFAKGNKQIITPTVTAGIRGTGLYAEASEQSTYFCLCYGEVDLSPMHQEARRFRVKASHHKAHTLDAKGSIEKSPLRNHSDDELAILEALAGRKPHALAG
ncbi:FecR domain-containing protein [Iodobacter sp. CM08]|uniref:FecR domain-containing protein n=1 Tax=Iodobacter sp. CM08 TaxID=3085902 RepID=UPI0029829C74|nr:FecR domain-containing protein [Iodobacter sp. CM08]MDW5417345.1 FecR domain-containing protein [Iodobacter sp. CM08]